MIAIPDPLAGTPGFPDAMGVVLPFPTPTIFDRIAEADAIECRAALRDLGHLRAAFDRVLFAGGCCEGVLASLQKTIAGEVADSLANLGLDALAAALDERMRHLENKDAA